MPLERRNIEVGTFNLNVESERLRVEVGGAQTLSFSAEKLTGTWASRVMEIKKRVGAALVAYSPAKQISASTQIVELTETDLANVATLEIVGTGTKEDGLVRVIAAAVFEPRTGVVSGEDLPVSGGEDGGFGGVRLVEG